MLLLVQYLAGCFGAGLALSNQPARRIVPILLVLCVVIATSYYWIDASRAVRAWAPPSIAPPAPVTVNAPIVGGGPQLVGRSIIVNLAWCAFLAGAIVMAWKPRWGICLMVFFALLGDPILAPWYPFYKGFSARESIFFVADWLIVSPLEVFILVALAAWLVDTIQTRRFGLSGSPLLVAAVAFAGWLGVGFVRGVVSRGNLNVALWELRGLAYIPVVSLLTARYIRGKAEVMSLMGAAMLAIAIEASCTAAYFVFGLGGHVSGLREIVDHPTSVHINTCIVLCVAAWLYRSSPVMRFGLPGLLPPLIVTYLANQRRAALVGLIVALALLLVTGMRVNRRLVSRLVPALGLLAIVWLALFWQNAGPVGLPARTVKSALNSTERTAKDRSSDYYRILEDRNIISTIREHPWLGVGFGRAFNLAVKLPSIDNFIWWPYITHNSVLWIWLKTGGGGFVTLLFLMGLAILTGANASLRVPDSDLGAVVVTAALYIVMHAIYAFVDIAWDLRSTVYLGAMMGVISCADSLANRGALQSIRRPLDTAKLQRPVY